MARAAQGSNPSSVWTGRTLERAVLITVILVFVVGIGRVTRTLQAQAEIGAVQSTLGALRVSLVVDHLSQRVRNAGDNAPDVVKVQRNPFKVLDRLPPNYAGEATMSQVSDVSPGNWVFDKACICVGYRPMHPEGLQPEADPAVLWFRVSAPPGPLQLTALKEYSWQNQTVK